MQKCLVSIIVFLLVFPALGQEQWTSGGLLVGTTSANPVNQTLISDGNGGFFTAYEHNPAGDSDIYAQWVDGSGLLRWGSGGFAINTDAGNQKNPAVAPDGAGGAFIAWHDEGTGKIKLQRINSNKTLLWPTAKTVSTASGVQSFAKMVSDAAGGVILVWKDERNKLTNGTDLYAQRIDANGNRLWLDTGVPVSEATGDQSNHVVQTDGAGGAYVLWTDYRGYSTTGTDIYAQRISQQTGGRQWQSGGSYEGIPVCSQAGNQQSITAEISGNNLIVAWEDYRNGGNNSDVYAQALNGTGIAFWTAGGVPATNKTGNQVNCRLTRDGSGGALVAWADFTLLDIWAQRLNASGARQWSNDGMAVITYAQYQLNPEIAPDDSGGAFIFWNDYRSGTNYDLYAQHVRSDQTLRWPSSGKAISTATGNQMSHSALTDGSGGALVVWADGRSGQNDLYAQHLNENVTLTQPPSGSLLNGGHSQTIRWKMRTTSTFYGYFVIKASVTPGDGFPVQISGNASPTALSVTWTPTTVNSATTQIQITAYNDEDVVVGIYTGPTFTVDSSPPAAFSLTSPASGATVEPTPTFVWQAATDNLSGLDHYELWIDGVLKKTGLAATTYTLTELEKLTDGSHTWTVKAVDKAGLIREASSRSLTARQDQDPPSAFHLLTPADNAWTTDTTPALSWQAATDAGMGLKKYKLYVDGSLHQDNIAPTTTTVSTSTLGNGSHTWYVVAVDSADNTRQSTETWTVKIDNAPPLVFALSAPATGSWTNDQTPTFAWQASSDAGIGLDHYVLSVDGVVVLGSVSKTATSVDAPSALNEGTHNWTLKAVDGLGNERSATTAFTIRVDVTPPNAFTLSAPQSGSFSTTSSPTFSWQSTTDAGSGLSHYELWIDGAINRDALSTTSATPASAMSEGGRTWLVKAVDAAGNIRTTSSWNVVVDTQPPLTYNQLAPAQGTTVHTNKPPLTWQTTSDATSGFAKFQVFVDGQLVADNLTAQQTSHTVSSALSNGSHTWQTKAWDNAGNVRTPVAISFTVSIGPPQFTSSGSVSATEDVAFTYTAAATDPDGDALTYSFENYPAWMTPSANTIGGTPTEGVPSGSFRAKVTDGIFTTTLDVAVTVTPVNDPPVLTSSGATTATEHQLFTYTATATDPENNPLTFTFSNFPTWLTPSGNKISGTSPEGSQNTSFTVTVSDGSLTDVQVVAITLQLVNDAPSITSPATAAAIEHQAFTYTATATDPENNPLTFTFSNFPTWLTPSGNKISGTPPEGSQNTSFTVTVSDGSLTDVRVVAITLQQVNDAPSITSSITATATEHQAFSYTATAWDPENNPLTFTFSNFPAWLTTNGSKISGTPPEGADNASFKIVVSDGSLTDQETVTVNLQKINDPPVITSSLSVAATEDEPFSYTATATDPESNPLQFSFSEYPVWMIPIGATISGAPGEEDQSTTFKVTASDGSLTETRTVTVTVTHVNDPPQITSSGTAQATEHQLFTYTATATDPENDPLVYTFSNYPKWMTPASNRISGTPTEGSQDTSFTVTVSDGKLTDVQGVTVRIQLVNDAPQITSATTATATEHQAFSYTATATDPENNPISFQYTNYPVWMSWTGATISGAPPEGAVNTTFKVTASDGSLSDMKTVQLTVIPVNDAPQITSATTANAVEHQAFSYTATAWDPESNPLTFAFSDYPSWMTPSGSKLNGTPPEGADNNTSFKVTVSDGSLTDQETVTVNLQKVNDPPVITSPMTVQAAEHAEFTYTATATDPENNPVTLTFSNYPGWMTVAQNKISGTPPESAVNTSFKLTARDGSLADVKTIQVNVSPVNDPPVITSVLSAAATEDAPFSYTATATDPENNPLQFSYSEYPAWMTPVGATISGAPREGDQSTAFKVTVTDGSLTDTRTVAVTVTQVNDPPQITSSGQVQATEDVVFSYTTSATDPENDPLTYSYNAYPGWLTPQGNKISGTPHEGDSDTSFVVVVSDGSLETQRTVRILVAAVNDPPEITSPDTASATEDVPFSYVATGRDIEGGPVTLTFDRHPAWLSTSGNRLFGTPTEGKKDTTFRVISSDGALRDTITVTLKVIAVNDAPGITSPDTVVAAEKSLFRYRATATDVDGPRVTLGFIYTQKWLSATGGEISGTPPNGIQKATFKVIAMDNHPTHPQTDTLEVTVQILPVNDPPYFEYDFPEPEWTDADTLQWVLPLDEYVKDPDNQDGQLSWVYRLLSDQNVQVSIHPVSHLATLTLSKAEGIIQIEFTVSDPPGATAKDTLTISLTRTGVSAERIADAPKEYTLYDNYPNPFNPETTIRYGLPKPSHVDIRIYNMLGQEVLTLIQEKQQPGTYEIQWYAAGHASGVYFYRIQAEDWQKVKRMLLLK